MAKKSAYLLMVTVVAMLALGIVMLYSIGAFARDAKGDPFFFLKRQSFYLVLGLVGFVAAAMIDYNFWKRTWAIWFTVALILLVLCFVPGIGMNINGSYRWVNLRFISFQPSEFAKFAAAVFIAFWFTHFQHKSHTFLFGLVFPLMILGVMLILIVAEIDVGTTALLATSALAVMFVAGTRMVYLLGMIVVGGFLLTHVLTEDPERAARFMAFMDLEKYAEGEGYQQYRGLLALASGGVDGRGLGSGRFKMDYLPYAHTDFIFPMIGEELGLRFTLAVVFGYLLILFCGSLIAMHASDRFGMLLGFGITSTVTFQAIINIGVTTALLPNKGFPLPFISYGGSDLMMCLFMMGVLVNIYRQASMNGPGDGGILLRKRVLHTRL